MGVDAERIRDGCRSTGQLTTIPDHFAEVLMRYSWFDLVLYLFAIVLLIPLVMRLVESISDRWALF